MQEKRYQQVADAVAAQIDAGVYGPGERLPSLRRLSAQHRVSISTVVQSYRLLEDRGLLIPRPQSGHFVRLKPARVPLSPGRTAPDPEPTQVTLSHLAMDVLRANESPGVVPLGTAMPYDGFPGVRLLQRTLASELRRAGPRALHNEPPPGLYDLRVQIARRASDAGYAVAPEEIVVTTGCQEALILSLRAVSQPGDIIAIESPAFYGTLQAIESLNLKALEIPTDPVTGIDLAAFEAQLARWPVAACILVPSFSNPLGSCMPDSNKQALIALLARHDAMLIEDDIYADLSFDAGRPMAVKAFDRADRVLLCSSFSKTLAPGIRLGWVAAGRRSGTIEHLKFANSGATATWSQLAMARFLDGGGYDRHLRTARAAYRAQRDRTLDHVLEYFPPGTRATCPQGGFLIWVELPPAVEALTLCRRALSAGVSVVPGPLFSPTRRYRNFIRLNCARPVDGTVRDAIRRLARLMTGCERSEQLGGEIAMDFAAQGGGDG